MSQIALPLSRGLPTDPASIVLGEANAHVAEALANPGRWPFGTAILFGPPRSGKSLFARWFAASGKGTAIDRAASLDETELFHRWNRAQESGEPLLLVADREGWDIALPDLASRLGAALHLRIGPPDDAMVGALIESHAARLGLALGDGAITYLVPRTARDFAGIERLVETIDRLTLERKAPATLGIWRDALDAVQGPEQARLL
ncbi:ATPase [Erythrobacter sp. 3-20A1M]|uniref:ATPase n=1 Tax=Erythrobacter sp. 3-20A1M TaxID=2653850 RepID=UPI001BFC58D3|nr:ATPase [Erythrobacter sp. 3-20A1M]QWC56057.1 ATPase [Erythrobacter sp. 3-20A1M]